MKKILSFIFVIMLFAVPLLASCGNETVPGKTDSSVLDPTETVGSGTDAPETTQNGNTAEPTETTGEGITTNRSGENDPTPITHFVSDEDRAKADSDNKYKWAVAFLEKDIETCTEMAVTFISDENDYDELEMFSPLSTLTFGSYSLEEEENYYGKVMLKCSFTVTDSEYDLFPVGEYEAYIYDSLYGISWNLSKPGNVDGKLQEEYPDLILFIGGWIVEYKWEGVYTPEKYKDYAWHVLTDHLFLTYEHTNNTNRNETTLLTYDQLQSVAYDLYGIEDFEPYPQAVQQHDNGLYSLLGHGGPNASYDIVNIEKNGTVFEIDIQYYGDQMYFSRGNVVRFTVSETDTIYDYRLDKIEVIETNYGVFFHIT